MTEYPAIHINRPRNQIFLARVRRLGFRRYEIIGRFKNSQLALKRVCSALGTGEYKRGDVLMVAKNPREDWYGPTVLKKVVIQ